MRGLSVEQLQTFAAPNAGLKLPVRRQLLAVALQQNVERFFLPLEAEDHVLGLRLIDALDERVLDQPEDRDLVVGRQAAVSAGARKVDAHAVFVDERLDIAPECRYE